MSSHRAAFCSTCACRGSAGLQLQQRLAEMRHVLPVVFLSGHGDIPSSVLAMKAGAQDFLTKPVATDVLLVAVEQAIARDRENRSAGRRNSTRMRSLVDALTPTERKVFDHVVRGKLNKQIALDLGTAERTIKWHRHNLMQKLQVQSLAELVSLAERLGMVGAHELARRRLCVSRTRTRCAPAPGLSRLAAPSDLRASQYPSFGAGPHQRTVSDPADGR